MSDIDSVYNKLRTYIAEHIPGSEMIELESFMRPVMISDNLGFGTVTFHVITKSGSRARIVLELCEKDYKELFSE